jgi:hypothetical protein
MTFLFRLEDKAGAPADAPHRRSELATRSTSAGRRLAGIERRRYPASEQLADEKLFRRS